MLQVWSGFDLAEEMLVFFSGSESVGKFFLKMDRKDLIALTDAKEEEKSKLDWLIKKADSSYKCCEGQRSKY